MTEFDDAVSTSSESASILSDDELPAEHQQLQAGSSSTSSTCLRRYCTGNSTITGSTGGEEISIPISLESKT